MCPRPGHRHYGIPMASFSHQAVLGLIGGEYVFGVSQIFFRLPSSLKGRVSHPMDEILDVTLRRAVARDALHLKLLGVAAGKDRRPGRGGISLKLLRETDVKHVVDAGKGGWQLQPIGYSADVGEHR